MRSRVVCWVDRVGYPDDDEDSQPTTSQHPCSLRHDEEDPLALMDGRDPINEELPSSIPIWKPSFSRNPAVLHHHTEQRHCPLQCPPRGSMARPLTKKPAVDAPIPLEARHYIVCPRWWT